MEIKRCFFGTLICIFSSLFNSFLSSTQNKQIYNEKGEKSKIPIFFQEWPRIFLMFLIPGLLSLGNKLSFYSPKTFLKIILMSFFDYFGLFLLNKGFQDSNTFFVFLISQMIFPMSYMFSLVSSNTKSTGLNIKWCILIFVVMCILNFLNHLYFNRVELTKNRKIKKIAIKYIRSFLYTALSNSSFLICNFIQEKMFDEGLSTNNYFVLSAPILFFFCFVLEAKEIVKNLKNTSSIKKYYKANTRIISFYSASGFMFYYFGAKFIEKYGVISFNMALMAFGSFTGLYRITESKKSITNIYLESFIYSSIIILNCTMLLVL